MNKARGSKHYAIKLLYIASPKEKDSAPNAFICPIDNLWFSVLAQAVKDIGVKYYDSLPFFEGDQMDLIADQLGIDCEYMCDVLNKLELIKSR